ncbi:RNA polymerase sigma factor [Devosia sp. XJ19-1]|uniref:RNA polymerase sigma factor n=1 Tax=Devosia ureilytica TaxID=2952754 RepID=A0A9Q4FSU4_9HYPH|nr:RNA polymerase sigma factor [Devosia ureilytica]MCP8883890.1 RNA polymerase sigma factor [Devosia ureilytica]MCP8887498.1 RNA polymerase sigma factor [Devosia ureilytica]
MSQGRMDAQSSTDLVIRAQAGDHAAIVGLLEHAQSDVRRYARRNCKLEDVDDAVQEAMTVLAGGIKALRSPAALAGWLFTVVKRECSRLGHWATSTLRSRAAAESLAAIAARPDPDLRYDLGMAIQSLPEHYRVIVIKRDLEERTIEEIAQAEGLSREAVKARLHRARLMIREYLTP